MSDINDLAYFDEDIFLREEIYSEYLHDGDFEEWQPVCYLKDKLNSELYDIGVINAIRENMRAIWIRNRLTDFGSPEWSSLVLQQNLMWKEFLFLKNRYEAKWKKKLTYTDLLVTHSIKT